MAKTLVLAEKPSVGKELARVLGCRRGADGYVEGDRYIVTWALGHLVEAIGATWCDLWWGETGEVVASLREDDEDDDDADLEECLDEDFFEDGLEMGFDPYEGNYTWDC